MKEAEILVQCLKCRSYLKEWGEGGSEGGGVGGVVGGGKEKR